MKDESCKTCKHRDGTKCNKNDEQVSMLDWCGSYRFKAADGVIDRFFKERKIARSENMVRGIS